MVCMTSPGELSGRDFPDGATSLRSATVLLDLKSSMRLRLAPHIDFADLAFEFGADGELLYQPEPLQTVATLNSRSVDSEDDAMSTIVD